MLVPRDRFEQRKLLVWCLVGPLHPVFIFSFFFAEREMMLAMAFGFAIPASLIGAFELFCLKPQTYERGALTLKTFNAMLIGIPVYTFIIGAGYLVFGMLTAVVPSMGFTDTVAFLFYFLFFMIAGFIVGIIPGILTLPYASVLLAHIAFKRTDDVPELPQTGTLDAPHTG